MGFLVRFFVSASIVSTMRIQVIEISALPRGVAPRRWPSVVAAQSLFPGVAFATDASSVVATETQAVAGARLAGPSGA